MVGIPIEYLLLSLMLVFWVLGGISGLFLRKKPTALLQVHYVGAMIGSIFGIVLSLYLIVQSKSLSIALWSVTPHLSFRFSLDSLSAFFLLLITLIALFVSIYSPKYAQKYLGKKNVMLLGLGFNLFLLFMAGVILASDLFTFLVMWETMSLLSFLLVVYDHEQKEVRQSGITYLIMTHLGTGFIIVAFLFLFLQSGSLDFSTIQSLQGELSTGIKHTIFLLALIGFGTKAGIVPIHIWLPRAHPVAPTNVSALMSGVMIKTALYGMVRVVYDFLGVTSVWWGVVLLLVGIITAVYGILYGVVQQDMKRFLAYSSVENMGLIYMALGASLVFAALELPIFSGFALLAALYHALNHAFFKGLLFMGAGAVYKETGTKNMEELGGLIRYMPQTAALFLIGSLAIASFPPFNGFISKWLTFQSLLNLPFFNGDDVWLSLLGTLGATTLFLVSAFVGLGFVKLFGVIFLAQPRTERVSTAKEAPLSMRIAMGLMSLGILCLGIFPGFIASFLNPVIKSLQPEAVIDPDKLFHIQSVAETNASIHPVLYMFTIGILLVIVIVALLVWVGRSIYDQNEPWACGIALEPVMSYSGMSFSQPLLIIYQFIFGRAYESRKHQKDVSFTIYMRRTFNHLIYDPMVRFVLFISRRIRRIQDGSIHTYLAYIFITLILFLLIVIRSEGG